MSFLRGRREGLDEDAGHTDHYFCLFCFFDIQSWSSLGLVSVSIMLLVSIMLSGLQKVLVQVGAVSATTLVCETHM